MSFVDPYELQCLLAVLVPAVPDALVELLRRDACTFHENLRYVVDPLVVAAPEVFAASREESGRPDLALGRPRIVRLVVLKALGAHAHRLVVHVKR